jgi:hypothetical protein
MENLIGFGEGGSENEINNCLLILRIQTLADCQKEAEMVEEC